MVGRLADAIRARPIGLLRGTLDPRAFERDSIVLNHRKAMGGKTGPSRDGPACRWPEVAITRQTSDCGD